MKLPLRLKPLHRSATILIGMLAAMFLTGCFIAAGHGGHTHHHPEEHRHHGERHLCGPGGPPPWAPAHGYRRKCRYRYYPHHEVYFSISAGTYFWRVEGTWRHGDSLPDHIHLEGADHVTLELKTDKPYEKHDEVRRKHGPKDNGHPGRGKGPPHGPPGHQ